MRSSGIRSFVVAVGVLASTTQAGSALADDRGDCVAAADKAQESRDEGKYRRARESMLLCSREVCPSAVRTDCVRWLGELESMAPSVVVNAREGTQDLTAIKVTMDGAVLVEKLDGKPIFVDPGEHLFVFERSGMPPKEERVLIRAGEKNRVLSVQFDSAAKPAAPPTGAKPLGVTDSPPSKPERPAPVLSYALGGVGVLGLASFAFFGLSGSGDVSDMESECKPTCAQDRVDSAKTKLLVADISLGVGVVALGAAAYFYFAQPKVEARSTAQVPPRWNFDLKPAPGGGTANLGGRF